jgi:hypothetical protein
MNGLRVLAFTVVALAVGLVAYQMGLSQGLATTLPAGAPPVAYYYPHWGYGFGFLGFLLPLFFLLLFFGAMRAAFGGGHRGYGHRGWASGRERIEELHRELHGERPSGDRPASTST